MPPVLAARASTRRSQRAGPVRSFDVVGPICESGDWLGRDRELALEQGDLLDNLARRGALPPRLLQALTAHIAVNSPRTTSDAGLAAKLRLARSHGMSRPAGAAPWVYEMAEPGFNYRLPDLLCALGLSQLAKLPRFAARRRALAAAGGGASAARPPNTNPADAAT